MNARERAAIRRRLHPYMTTMTKEQRRAAYLGAARVALKRGAHRPTIAPLLRAEVPELYEIMKDARGGLISAEEACMVFILAATI